MQQHVIRFPWPVTADKPAETLESVSIAMQLVFDDAGALLEAVSGQVDSQLAVTLSELDHHHYRPASIPFALFDYDAGELWLKVADGVGVERRWQPADLHIGPTPAGSGAFELELRT